MGGEDWADWIDALKAADVLTENAVTVAYSYIGPELTYPIYYHGTIGTAKQHLQKTMSEINQAHPDVCAVISVNKGLVTQASAAIPVVPLYFAILYKVMKKPEIMKTAFSRLPDYLHRNSTHQQASRQMRMVLFVWMITN